MITARHTHLVITDSGLGGVSICAALERAIVERGLGDEWRLTYVNVWPDEHVGYNGLPDTVAQAAVFDRALQAIDRQQPDRILIACNTLSIVYAHTAHIRHARVPVEGIIDAGVALFDTALAQHADATLILIGTRTTIASEVHRRALIERGIAADRVSGAACHGLATAIERAVRGPETKALLDTCVDRIAALAHGTGPLLVGLCCTHYGLVGDDIARNVEARVGRPTTILDPNTALLAHTVSGLPFRGGDAEASSPVVTLISKVRLPDATRENVATSLSDASPATAAALRHYVHDPDLF